MKFEISRQIFENTPLLKSLKPSHWERSCTMRADGQTDITRWSQESLSTILRKRLKYFYKSEQKYQLDAFLFIASVVLTFWRLMSNIVVVPHR